MNLKNLIRVSYQSLLTNKGRSILTMLGVIIGVAAVILLVSIGNGLRLYVSDQFEQLGSNNIFVAPGDVFNEDGGGFSQDQAASSFISNKLKVSDVEDIKRLREFVEDASPLSFNAGKISYKSEQKNTTVLGVYAEYPKISNSLPEIGRSFTKAEEKSGDKVAYMGFKIAEELFGEVDPVGKTIKINSSTFKVLGVAEEKGSSFGGPSFDSYVYLPFKTASDLFDNSTVTRIFVRIKDTDRMDESIQALETLLLKRLDDEDFSVFDSKEILKIIDQILGVLTAGLGGIAAISLVVGGIGIMNIMLVSVTERTREIGLRKAIGATPGMILMQFLIEAIMLSVGGGLIGVGIAYGLTLLINQFIPASVTLSSVLLAFFVSAAVGIVFGVYPARRASKLSPIEALRYE